MKHEAFDKIRLLNNAAKTLERLPEFHKEKISDSSCDKYDFRFGGDDRFAVFKTTVFLDCHHGYYGNSSCYTAASIDNTLATKLLNRVLNKRRDQILAEMAKEARVEAEKLVGEARKELEAMQAVIEKLTTEQPEQ